VDLAAGTPARIREAARNRPRVAAALAAAAAVTVFSVFALSVVWYFATHAGFLSGHGAAAVLGADAYVLVLLGLLALLPARRGEQTAPHAHHPGSVGIERRPSRAALPGHSWRNPRDSPANA
jgi:hypothetical protein